MIGLPEIQHRFGYHPGTPDTIKKHEELREAFIMFANFIDLALPDSRAKSTAMTKLQEASMWANFGIAEQAPVVLPNQTPPSEQLLLPTENV